jgi:signal transduction histidine kinase
MRGSVLWKLVAINVPIIALVIMVVWLTIDYLAADYFAVLMEKYNISPAETHQMFLDAVHRYLIQASLAAVALGLILSLLLTRKVLKPLSRMAEVTRRVAAGDYTARADLQSKDEIGRLALAIDQMTASLDRTEKLRKSMVSDIAHELRTPLTTVRGYLEALIDGIVPPSNETFVMLQSEILRLVRLVEDLNQLAQAEAASARLEREEVYLPDLADQVLNLYARQFQSSEISVERHFDDAATRIQADRDKLLQVLRNLVQNASRYTPPGGRVRLEATREGDFVKVTLVNSGEGIAEEDLPFIFERFYRADKSRSRDSGGAGIGLAIVKELIQSHGGEVGAANADGLTRVWFTLPV